MSTWAVLSVIGAGVLALVGGSGNAATTSPVASARPVIVYWKSAAPAELTRLQGSTVAQSVVIGLTNPDRVTEVAFLVDEPKASKAVYAVDRRAPFTLPRSGSVGASPYALGRHTLRADITLVSNKHLRLLVSYSVAHILDVTGPVDGASLRRRILAAPPGPVYVRPAPGSTSFSVSGDVEMTRSDVSIQGAVIDGVVTFSPGSDRSALLGSHTIGFDIFGADDILLRGNLFDGLGLRKDNSIWDEPAGSTPDRYRIIGNTFQNFYDDRGVDVHSQAIFVGYSTDGLIDGNVFNNNGSTSHIFISWWGDTADPARSSPQNICIRRNRFGPVHGAYFAVNFRAEIPVSSGIKVAPSNVSESGLVLSSERAFVRNC